MLEPKCALQTLLKLHTSTGQTNSLRQTAGETLMHVVDVGRLMPSANVATLHDNLKCWSVGFTVPLKINLRLSNFKQPQSS